MHPDLSALLVELDDAEARAHRLADAVDDARWMTRPHPRSWSMSECVVHLTLANDLLLGPMDEALGIARTKGHPPPERYRRDLVGWLLSRSLEPPARTRIKTTDAFTPPGALPKAAALTAFSRSQEAMRERIRAADGIHAGRVKVISPFDARVGYSLYSAFRINGAHQRRHLWQAERVLSS